MAGKACQGQTPFSLFQKIKITDKKAYLHWNQGGENQMVSIS
jgi:hypothetical protein